MGARHVLCAALVTVWSSTIALVGWGAVPVSADSHTVARASSAQQSPARSAVTAVQADVTGTKVKLQGKTKAAKAKVKVHRWSAETQRWRKVAQATSRKHRFQVTVRQSRVAERYRFTAPKQSAVVKQVKLPKQTDACGVRPAKADGTLWSCSFVDEFNGTSLDTSKWIPQVYGYATGSPEEFACYSDSTDHVAVRDGALQLTLAKHEAPSTCADGQSQTQYWSGMVSTYERFSQTYGRFEARMRSQATTAPGLHEAFWLYVDPRTTNGYTGEIDVVETYSSHPDLAIPYLHYDANPRSVTSGPNQTTAYNCRSTRGSYHTYRLEWTAAKIQIFVDDKLCLTNTSADPAFRQNFMVAFTQALGSVDNAPVATTPYPATMSVDWIRVWK
ncbi:glycoside hydrolase family 16 protein [Nocardioides dubius]|uniref:GH16 domain-containing protein n=1 Tax=Nocardioides dubius TaxID=317019 RepID=A0ABP4EKU9_9ACTN